MSMLVHRPGADSIENSPLFQIAVDVKVHRSDAGCNSNCSDETLAPHGQIYKLIVAMLIVERESLDVMK